MFWDYYTSLCKISGLSPNAVAKQIGVSNATCTKWKNGTIPNGETLIAISDFFDCSVDYLLGRTENAKAHKTNLYPQEYTELLEKYSHLDDTDRIKIIERIDTLLDDDKYKNYTAVSQLRSSN